MKTYRAMITATARYLPEKTVTNFDLAKTVDTSDEWIRTRTGIRARRIAKDEETASSMGTCAVRALQERHAFDPEAVNLIIVATATPDMTFPSTASIIQRAIGATNAASMDITAACSGFVYAAMIATAFIESGRYETILVIASEKNSSIVDWLDRGTCVLFGDAATATLFSRSKDDSGIIAMYAGADGSKSKDLFIPAGGSREPATLATVREHRSTIWMNGQDVFKSAVQKFRVSIERVIADAGITKDDIALIIPHQANIRIINAVQKDLGIPSEKIIINLTEYGNTSAASVPLALGDALNERRISKGDYLVFATFGAGFTWGAMLLKW